MAGGLNPVIVVDVLNSLGLRDEERLLVYECLRIIVDIEGKKREKSNKDRPKSSKDSNPKKHVIA